MSAAQAALGERSADDEDTVERSPMYSSGSPPSGEPVDVPRFLGRYMVLDAIGHGGMGHVFRAYDPELDREVAIKLLRRVSSDARARLVREAQAMARLSHPNVLPVFDVATAEYHLFLAMELVRGQSLRAWLDAAARAWSEVLDVFVAAGHGLVAAHAAGLVHRDFKPANVLLGDDGRVRVMDFGLARGTTSASGSLGSDYERGPASVGLLDQLVGPGAASVPYSSDVFEVLDSFGDQLTQAGVLVGTPPYMAPEQHLGHTADARSDQYSFCVALWEALYGRRPFAAEHLDDWYRAKTTAHPQHDPARDVPRWLHTLLLRGLAAQPSERHGSMSALLDALVRGRRRRRGLALAVSGAFVLGAGAALYGALGGPVPCGGARDKLAGIWDDATAAEVERAMLATAVGYAPDTWDRVAPQLDDYAARWEAAHGEACAATHVRHEQSEAEMDARMRCLDERRRSLRALMGTLREADAHVVEHAVLATGTLPAIEPCADPRYVHAQGPPPRSEAIAVEVDALEDELARLEVRVDAGQAVDAEAGIRAVLARAEALGHPPLEVQARLQLADLEDVLGRYEAAAGQLEQVYFDAQREGLDVLQARAAIRLINVLDARLAQLDAGERWERFAHAALQRVHEPRLAASYLISAGVLAYHRGEHETAIVRFERAQELLEQELGPEHLMVAVVLNDLANVYDQQGHYDEALALHERALAIREHALGPSHPDVATSLLNVSNVQRSRARYDEALALMQRAHAIFEQAYGPDHPHTATALANLGTIYEALGQPERALEHYTAALPLLERSKGHSHPHVAAALENIGNVYKTLGNPARALEHYERSLQILERMPGPASMDLAITLTNLGAFVQEQGDEVKAATYLDRALEIVAATVGLRHPVAAVIHTNRALVHGARGEHEQALELLRRALELHRELLGARHPSTVMSLGQLGQALLAADRPAEAIEPLEQVIEIASESGDQAATVALAQELLDEARARLARTLQHSKKEEGLRSRASGGHFE